MKSRGIFVEVTTLIVPGLNDDPTELKELATFIVQDLGVETPWHISRFHPTYKLSDRPAMPRRILFVTNAEKQSSNAGVFKLGRCGLKMVIARNAACQSTGCGSSAAVLRAAGSKVQRFKGSEVLGSKVQGSKYQDS